MSNLTPEMILGLIATFGVALVAILMMLKRFGILRFVNGDQCSDHIAFCNSFKKMRDVQIIQGETIKQHEKRLNDGAEVLKEIKKDVSSIRTDVAVLLEKVNSRRKDD